MVGISQSYGSVKYAGDALKNQRRRFVLGILSSLIGVACVSFVAINVLSKVSLVQRMSDKFLFQTPTLKSLVGTFMTEQGASKSDIKEVRNYFSTKKAARVQMLHDLSGDNTQTSLAWKPAHEVVGAAFQPIVDALTKRRIYDDEVDQRVEETQMDKDEVGLSDSPPATQAFGTDAVYIGKGDGSGQSTKASIQQLWDDESKETDLKSGRRPFLKDVRSFRKVNNGWMKSKATYWNKAPVQQLWDDESKETDLRSGRRPFLKDVRSFRNVNNGWMKSKATYWNKAPVQQLFVVPAPFHDTVPQSLAPLPEAGIMGTNHAFLNRRVDGEGRAWYEGKGDGDGVSVAAPTQQLAQSQLRGPVLLPDAGEVGTDRAFLEEKVNEAGGHWLQGLGDGDGQST